ncbi:MAG: 50S ribosomal protein L30 [Humidesulfovibrio sp.]|nr:50S ribosomal protein L30 [Humidesulfovibrio sp.]PKN09875.1 MAG: 50S ribosomal protein L30 [Deltaproteobacteria bacterium HGW-Deltaproteobacteria-8]
MFKIKLLRSRIGCTPKQRQTLDALGLKHIRQEKSFEEAPAVAGMIAKVNHLIEVTKS